MPARIYTKTGDRGKTSLVDGSRVAKSDLRLEAYGTIDELNCALGLSVAEISNEIDNLQDLHKALYQAQNQLFIIGGRLACRDQEIQKTLPALPADASAILEKQIDAWSSQLTPLTNFILPGGAKLSAQLHFSRAVCRRAERHIVALTQTEQIDDGICIYINRLSDWLFVAARWSNAQFGRAEQIWQKS